MSLEHYRGVKISLISKSNIRYVGILESINQVESSIALSNVCSCGTEGRRNGVNEVPPVNTVYGFISFRAADVLDLRVLDQVERQPPPRQHIPDDPAILQTTRPTDIAVKPAYPMAQPPSPWAIPPPHPNYPPPGTIPPPVHMQPAPMHPHQLPAPQPSPLVPNPAQNPRPKAPQSAQPPEVPPTPETYSQKAARVAGTAAPVPSTPKAPSASVSSATAPNPQPTNAAVKKEPSTNANQELHAERDRKSQGGSGRGVRRGRGRGGRGGASQVSNGTNASERPDFDFESANAKFKKEDLVKELAKMNISVTQNGTSHGTESSKSPSAAKGQSDAHQSLEKYYDKNVSFFDNISCDAKERLGEATRPDRRVRLSEERKLNIKTFGQSSVDSGRYGGGFRRGRGRGLGFRGGFRGRGRGRGRGVVGSGRGGLRSLNGREVSSSSSQPRGGATGVGAS